jgi:hypothetical protein
MHHSSNARTLLRRGRRGGWYILGGLCLITAVSSSQWFLLVKHCRDNNTDSTCSNDHPPNCDRGGLLRASSLDSKEHDAAFQESPDVLKMFDKRCDWYRQNKDKCDHSKVSLKPLQSLCVESKVSASRTRQNSTQAHKSNLLHTTEDTASTANNPKRIAILLAGSLRRYFFESDMKHLIQPLTQQGYQVDYYLLLTTSNPPAFRSGSGYMDYLSSDPLFYSDPTREQTLFDDSQLKTTVTNSVKEHGGTLRSFVLQDHVDIDGNSDLEARRQVARALFPMQDVDLRFPMYDVRPTAQSRTANGNRNMLRLFMGLQLLWDAMRAVEDEQAADYYDYVILLRDDAMWLHDFDMDRLIQEDPTADAYILSCNARDPPMAPEEINDHGMVMKRNKAEPFGRYLDTLLRETDIEDCQKSVSESISKGGIRGCNSEMLLKWNIQYQNLKVKLVGQDLIPFQRAAHVRFDNGTIVECYHKYCESAEDPLIPNENVERCKALPFSSTSTAIK